MRESTFRSSLLAVHRFPPIQQWNIVDSRRSVPELRLYVHEMSIDVPVLQETNGLQGEYRLSQFVQLHSMTSQRNRRFRALHFLKTTIPYLPIDLSSHCSDIYNLL